MRVPCKFSRKKKRKKTLWRSARNHLFPCWCLSRRTQMSEKLYISLQQGRCRLSGGVELGRERGREGWVGGWVLSHLLALLAVYPHVLAILLCKLCIQGFAVHVRTVRAHTNTGSYLCPSPRAGYLHQNEMKWEMKLESECLSESFFFFFFIPRMLTYRMRFSDDESEHSSHHVARIVCWGRRRFTSKNEVGKHDDRCFIWDGKCSGWAELCGWKYNLLSDSSC